MGAKQARRGLAALLMLTAAAAAAAPAMAAPASTPSPWMNAQLSPDARADLLLARMTQAEKLNLVSGFYGVDQAAKHWSAPSDARQGQAGVVPGIPRLSFPPQWESDAGEGVATQGAAKQKFLRTALPSSLATTATWNPELAFQGGAMIGNEARNSGMNVMLAGGVNLMREPRNGRNFEYGGEDPLLAGTMGGAQIAGIQSNHIISTVKHYAYNDQETGRTVVDVRVDDAAGRMSDLLAFELAIERADPGSVMCSYNLVMGTHACENTHLLTEVLRDDWGYQGYVMSDWEGTHSTAKAALAGLDQEDGVSIPTTAWFAYGKLDAALEAGEAPQARLDLMAHRILRTFFAKGVMDHPVAPAAIDYSAHAAVTRADETQAMVLLKNAHGVLPLAADKPLKIAVIGGHADAGVLAGGGSALVYPRGGNAVPGLKPATWPGPVVYDPSSPLAALKARLPKAEIAYADGTDPAAAAALAAKSDVVLVFATQWTAESVDFSLTLPDQQDALIAAVAAANPRTVVVLETGGPVLTPWRDQAAGIVEAWFPGTAGGEAIADVLTGRADASGRLPVSFPASLDQLPRPKLDGEGVADNTAFAVSYDEGAAVGYKWYDRSGLTPAFAFGHGLSSPTSTLAACRRRPRATAWRSASPSPTPAPAPAMRRPRSMSAARAGKRRAGWAGSRSWRSSPAKPAASA
jgi:beta-glucosidase